MCFSVFFSKITLERIIIEKVFKMIRYMEEEVLLPQIKCNYKPNFRNTNIIMLKIIHFKIRIMNFKTM
jgi:hypothetical protein